MCLPELLNILLMTQNAKQKLMIHLHHLFNCTSNAI